MPLGCRNVDPVFLGAHQVSLETEDDVKNVLSTVANNAIVGALLQLSSLVRHADDLFCDISDECQKVFERTDKLNTRINQLESNVSKLDAKQVAVPEGDLKQFTAISSHHEARHGYDNALFLPTNRTQCVQDQYALCATNPTRVIRSADLYRKDGLSGSKMFKCWPVMLNEHRVQTPDLSLPRRIQRVRSFEKKYKQLKIRERPKTIHGFDDFCLDECNKKNSDEVTECLMVTDPPVVVSIDTSGSNFERMQSQRLSGRRYQTKEEREKKKRRRRTVSGVPENIMYEIERFDRRKKITDGPRQTPRSYSFDDLDAEDDTPRDEGIVKYLDEIEGKMEERSGEEKADKYMKFFPCRRSRSLPRCMKLTAATARSLSADRKSNRDLNTTYTSSSLSLSSMASTASSRLSRAARRSTLLSTKLKSLVASKDKPRPKSLDVDIMLDDTKDSKRAINEKERSKSTYSLERNHSSQRVPDNLLSQEFSKRSDSTIGPGSYYNFESSTLPRAQAKKYDFPWESLPKDWTTSVKLREISKRRAKEDRQSSSGNWSQSGTNSNRHSLDSDLRSEGFKFNSQYSLGKDSGRDSLTLEENDYVTDGTSTAGYAGDGTSTITGDTVSIGNPKTDFEQQETEAWIRSLAIRAAKHEESGNNEKGSTLSRLTRQNILALDLMMSDDKSRKITDEESSVYSVDQEGFYTSFHNDSGLKKSTNTLVDEDDISPTKDSVSVCSVDSVIHRPVRNDKFAGIRKGNSSGPSKVISKVVPPSAPQFEGSGNTDSEKSSSTQSTPDLHSFPSQDSSLSESSDPDVTFARIHEKTHLSATGFPSLTALSTSDDESPDSASEKLRKISKITCDKYIFNETDSDLGLSDFGETSGFSFLSHPTGSFFGSSKSEFTLTSESSLKHSKSAVECSNKGFDSQTVAQELQGEATVEDKTKAGYQSWPRALKSTPTSGILKTPEKQFDTALKPQKTLNFAPMVNLFKHGEDNSVQLPLPSPTNSSSSESTFSPHSSFVPTAQQDQSYKLSVPIDNKFGGTFKPNTSQINGGIPLKYQPTITVTPRSRSRSGERSRSGTANQAREPATRSSIYASSNVSPNAQSTPQVYQSSSNSKSPNLYAISPVLAAKGQKRSPASNYGNHGYMDMHTVGSLRSAESASSLASSNCLDFPEGSGYMSMSSPSSSPNLSNMDFSVSSTPSGSMDSLHDLRKTPTNELDNDTYRINTNLLTNRQNSHSSTGSTGSLVDSRGSRGQGSQNGRLGGEQKSFRLKETSNSNGNMSDVSFSSYKSTPGRRSVDSTDNDLTRVTQLSNQSAENSYMSPYNPRGSSDSKTPRQMGRQSRADTRKESSYRNQNNRRSLPADMSGNQVYTQNVPLNDRSRTQKQSVQPQKSMSSSKSCPTGFNAQNMQVRPSQNTNRHSSYAPVSKAQADPAQISTRTDSYRNATSSTRMGSYRGSMHSSKSFPSLPPTKQSGPYRVAMDMSPNRAFNVDDDDDDVMSRADSYRIAVRNTNGIVPDMANRNSSYRVAVKDELPSSVTSKLDALSIDSRKSPGGRDLRRMGITDVDQAKDISVRPTSKEAKSSHSQQNGGGRIRKVTKQDVDPIEIVQTVDYRGSERKANKNKENRSSTYIQFDPIFEDTEDFSMGLTPDVDLSSRDYSMNLSNTSKSKYGLINGAVKDANSNNIKGLQKSKSTKSIDSTNSSGSGRSVDLEDSWRFSQV